MLKWKDNLIILKGLIWLGHNRWYWNKNACNNEDNLWEKILRTRLTSTIYKNGKEDMFRKGDEDKVKKDIFRKSSEDKINEDIFKKDIEDIWKKGNENVARKAMKTFERKVMRAFELKVMMTLEES